MKYSEQSISNWINPPSDTEKQKITNTINMIRSAIDSSTELKALDIEVFVQGSYANNTNVRTISDVDVCVMLTNTFFVEYPEGKGRNDYGFTEGCITFDEYRRRVKKAIADKFGPESVVEGNKSLKVKFNSYHVNADVVVAFMLKDYSIINSSNVNSYVEGIRFIAMDGKTISNYPKDHIVNGKNKNVDTSFRYKKVVRIFKRIRNEMVDEGITNGDIISSFLVECLIWNVPNRLIVSYPTWTETVRQAIVYLYNAIKDGRHTEWGEVSERLYLFRHRKWTSDDAKEFLNDMWNYMEY